MIRPKSTIWLSLHKPRCATSLSLRKGLNVRSGIRRRVKRRKVRKMRGVTRRRVITVWMKKMMSVVKLNKSNLTLLLIR